MNVPVPVGCGLCDELDGLDDSIHDFMFDAGVFALSVFPVKMFQKSEVEFLCHSHCDFPHKPGLFLAVFIKLEPVLYTKHWKNVMDAVSDCKDFKSNPL